MSEDPLNLASPKNIFSSGQEFCTNFTVIPDLYIAIKKLMVFRKPF